MGRKYMNMPSINASGGILGTDCSQVIFFLILRHSRNLRFELAEVFF